jgi:hypothetical protein
MSPASNLPEWICPRRQFGEVSANSSAPEWRDVPVIELRESIRGGVPVQGTQVRCGWDDAELRVLFTCVDRDVWATMTKHDDPLWDEEVVEIFIDPTGDGLSYFELEVNPLNATVDLVLRKSRSGWKKDFAWDCEGFRTAVERTDTGWNAILAIPFGSLASGAPGPGSEWRANFFRIDRPPGLPWELSAWSPTLCDTFHVPERFGHLRFE